MTRKHSPKGELPLPMRRLYRYSSVVWAVYATALSLLAFGSTVLQFAVPARLTLGSLAAIVGLGMIVRAFAPGRPEWTRWTLPVVGGTSVATFSLFLFGLNIENEYTAARLGVALLVLTPGAVAYGHYMGEKVVAPR